MNKVIHSSVQVISAMYRPGASPPLAPPTPPGMPNIGIAIGAAGSLPERRLGTTPAFRCLLRQSRWKRRIAPIGGQQLSGRVRRHLSGYFFANCCLNPALSPERIAKKPDKFSMGIHTPLCPPELPAILHPPKIPGPPCGTFPYGCAVRR